MTTTTATNLLSPAAGIETAPAHMVDGGRFLGRMVQRVFGSGLVLAAFGIWLLPGSEFGPDLALMKLIIALCLGLMGIGMIHASKEGAFPEVEIDMVRREARLIRRDRTEIALLARCKFDDLSRVEHEGEMVRLWDENDTLLAEVSLSDPATRRGLIGALKQAGKL